MIPPYGHQFGCVVLLSTALWVWSRHPTTIYIYLCASIYVRPPPPERCAVRHTRFGRRHGRLIGNCVNNGRAGLAENFTQHDLWARNTAHHQTLTQTVAHPPITTPFHIRILTKSHRWKAIRMRWSTLFESALRTLWYGDHPANRHSDKS